MVAANNLVTATVVPIKQVAAQGSAASPASPVNTGKNKIAEILNLPIVKVGVTLAVVYAIHKYSPKDMPQLRAAAYGVAGVVLLKNTPLVKDYAAI